MEFKFTNHFKKTYNKLVRRNPACAFDILSALLTFSKNPYDPKLETTNSQAIKRTCGLFQSKMICELFLVLKIALL